MLKTLKGIYQNGQIQLGELPQDISDRSQVLVTFLEPSKIDPTKLWQLIDQLETIAGIQQGFEELNAGLTCPIENFVQEMQQKYDFSGWNYPDRFFWDWASISLVSRAKSRFCRAPLTADDLDEVEGEVENFQALIKRRYASIAIPNTLKLPFGRSLFNSVRSLP